MNNNLLFKNYLALVVDDELLARTVAKRTLTQLGFDFIEADDGASAVKLLQHDRPDLILLDVEMTHMNGVEACRCIRNMGSFNNTPIIMMTSLDDAESIDHAFESGATDFITKPVNWALLKHKIKYVMRNQEVLLELTKAERIASIGSWRQIPSEQKISLSAGMREMLGIVSDKPIDIIDFVHQDDQDDVRKNLEGIDTSSKRSLKHRMITAGGETLVVEHRAQTLVSYSGKSRAVVGTIQDVTERELANRRVHELAYHDSVTKVFNRTATLERLDFLIDPEKQSNIPFALLHVDIDNFKRINDSLGPEIGDQLLRSVSDRVVQFLRDHDMAHAPEFITKNNIRLGSNLNLVARLGADTFAIILAGDMSKSELEPVCAQLVSELGKSYKIGMRELTISVSIGAAMHPDHGKSATEIYQNADTAMHSVKTLSKNDYKFYDSNLSDVLQRKMQLEDHIRIALHHNEFSLHYQPQIEISNFAVVGAEALLRWNSAELGPVSPADFIPLAEEIGLIVPIGNWVLNTACEQLVQWKQDGVQLPRMAVNISVRQFNQEDFVAMVSNTIMRTGVNPQHLELELTESLLAVDVSSAIKKLEALKKLGVEISVDDFGTGYSSLSYLKKFPIDRLKIDQSFVRDIDHDNADVAITTSIIGLARGLSLSVIAEGVETDEHLAKLTELGCDEAQGYLIGKPLPSEKFVEWLDNYNQLLQSKGLKRSA